MSMYRVKLSNGNVLSGLELNGSAFDTKEAISRETFSGGLREVKIEAYNLSEGEYPMIEGTFEGMTLGYIGRHGDTTSFVLQARDPVERRYEQLRADVDYLALVTGEEL